MNAYFSPLARWTDVLQNDFAARADWCVKSYEEANHPPVVRLNHALDLNAKSGETVKLSAQGTSDPDGDELTYHWWQYSQADTYGGVVEIDGADAREASIEIPNDAKASESIYVICEVRDNGTPPLSRYQRVVLKVNNE